MVTTATISVFDFTVGALATLGLLYLLYSETVVVHYRRFFRLVTFGLLVYAATGPVIGMIRPAYIHAIHGLAALFISVGLYELVVADLKHEPEFDALLAADTPGFSVDAPEFDAGSEVSEPDVSEES